MPSQADAQLQHKNPGRTFPFSALQVGGTLPSLEAHIAAVRKHPLLQGRAIDFKLQASGGACSAQVQHEVQFDKLAIKLCEVGEACMQGRGLHA